MKISLLIIDDRRRERVHTPGAVVITTAEEAVRRMEAGEFDDGVESLALDHDLGCDDDGNKLTIMPFIKALESRIGYDDNPLPVDRVFVHTSNPSGKQAIMAAFSNKTMRPHYPSVRAVTDTDLGLYDPGD